MAERTTRYAVVTGANKGIGFGICKQLASNGITVVLTARDENRGLEAIGKLKESGGVSDRIFFHQLDVSDPGSIACLADFIKTQFGKLDILVNNAGVSGVIIDSEAFRDAYIAKVNNAGVPGSKLDGDSLRTLGSAPLRTEAAVVDWKKIFTETYELSEECIRINYYGTKRMSEALLPLLQLSDSPRIVNVSSIRGKLQNLSSNECAMWVFSDADNLSEEKVDKVLNEFLKDSKEGAAEAKGWPAHLSAYTVSKAAINAYTRVLAKKYPNVLVNCVCPGYVKTDITCYTGHLTIDEGAESPVRLALLPNGGPSGLFFIRKEESPF